MEQGREDHHIWLYKIHQEHYCKFWNERLQAYKHILCQQQQNHENGNVNGLTRILKNEGSS